MLVVWVIRFLVAVVPGGIFLVPVIVRVSLFCVVVIRFHGSNTLAFLAFVVLALRLVLALVVLAVALAFALAFLAAVLVLAFEVLALRLARVVVLAVHVVATL